MRVCLIIGAAFLLLASCAGGGLADESPRAPGKPTETFKLLLKQLGDEQYEVREAASRKLMEAGLAALPLLEKQEKNPDREIRFRCRRIAGLIRDGDLEERLQAFVEGFGRAEAPTLPGWRRFHPVVGDSRNSRQIYAAMVRQEDKLLRSLDAGPEAAHSALLSSCQQFITMENPALDETFVLRVMAYLFVAGQPDAKSPEQAIAVIYRLCQLPRLQSEMKSGAKKEGLKKLLSRLIDREHAMDASTFSGLTIAMMYDLPAGLRPAKRILQAKNSSPEWRRQAIVTVAKLGRKRADKNALAKILEQSLDDGTVYYVGRFNQRQIQTTLGDVALAALVLLVGEEHEDYGFEFLRRQEPNVFALGTCGFGSEDKRQLALAKWRLRSK